MKFSFVFFFMIPLLCFSQEHKIVTGKSLDRFQFGYSTLSDIREQYKSEIITDTITSNCPHTDKCGKSIYGELNSLFIKKLGMVFQANYQTGELIHKVLLYAPFKGKIDATKNIALGKTTVKEIYKQYPKSSLTSTNGKEYWIIKNDNISFLVTRLASDKNYPIEFTAIENRLIKTIILNPIRDLMDVDFEDSCRIPLFAPKTETHRNCYVSKRKIGFYTTNFGGLSNYKSVKSGYWKEYYPNHIIKEEGNYKKGKQIGEFKYYDKNGTVIKTKKHPRFLFW